MKKSQQKKFTNKKHKSIKNIYIHKINSLKKIMGGPNFSLPCLCTSRKNLLLDSQDDLVLKRRENNKDAAKKARLRKKLYMELLEETIASFRQLDEEGKCLEKMSNDLLFNSTVPMECKQEDEIGQYLLPSQVEMAAEKVRKDLSQVTMDAEKGCDFNKILIQIEMTSFPEHMAASRLKKQEKSLETARIVSKMEEIQQQLPQIFMDLRNISSDHSSLLVLSCSSNPEGNVDPYFGKTLMEEYYSKTLCRKDAVGIETHKSLNFLARMEKYLARSQQISSSDFMLDQ